MDGWDYERLVCVCVCVTIVRVRETMVFYGDKVIREIKVIIAYPL